MSYLNIKLVKKGKITEQILMSRPENLSKNSAICKLIA